MKNFSDEEDKEPNEGLSHASQLVILHTQRLTTTIGPWQQTCITPPSNAATAGGAATTTMGSRAPRYVFFLK